MTCEAFLTRIADPSTKKYPPPIFSNINTAKHPFQAVYKASAGIPYIVEYKYIDYSAAKNSNHIPAIGSFLSDAQLKITVNGFSSKLKDSYKTESSNNVEEYYKSINKRTLQLQGSNALIIPLAAQGNHGNMIKKIEWYTDASKLYSMPGYTTGSNRKAILTNHLLNSNVHEPLLLRRVVCVGRN